MSDHWNPADPDATRVVYDLSAWTFDQQAELAAELADAEVPHAWDGSELMVPEEFEGLADATIGAVEDRLGVVYADDEADDTSAVAAEPIPLTDGEATTEYELDEWPAEDRERASRALVRGSLPFRWEADVLVVHTADEEVVEALLDMVESGQIDDDQLDGSAAGGEDDQLPFETLTVFFLAGERLRRDPLNADGLEQLLEAVDAAESERPPFGVDPRLWQRACTLADDLAGALVDGDEPDEAAAMDLAEELHDLLRPYV